MTKTKLIKLDIPFLPKSLNELFSIHHMKRYSYFKDWKKYVSLSARGEKLIPEKPFEKVKVSVCFVFPDNKTRDMDNYIGGAKGLMDGLKKAKIIKDDCWQRLKVEYKGKLGNVAKTEVVIREVKKI
jgi:Holliday junction resolvase RusA-like endonuclease